MSNLTPARQPVAYATIASLIVTLAARLGLNMSVDQAIAVMGALQVLAATFIHTQVTPTTSIPAIVDPPAPAPIAAPVVPPPAPALPPDAPVDPLLAVVADLRASIERQAIEALTAAVAAQGAPSSYAPPAAVPAPEAAP